MVVAVVCEEWVHRRTDPVTEQILPIIYVRPVPKVRTQARHRYCIYKLKSCAVGMVSEGSKLLP